MKFTLQEDTIIETKILDVINLNEKIFIKTLSSNIRHKFGGQPEDRGYFFLGEWVKILSFFEIDKQIVYEIPASNMPNVHSGMMVLMKRDKKVRLKISRMHSAAHLICAIAPFEMVRSFIGLEISRIDFRGNMDLFIQLKNELNLKIKKEILNSRIINIHYLTSEEIKQIGKVEEFKDNMKGILRVVEIENLDMRTCLGTHLLNTSLIGELNFKKIEKVKDDIFKINFSLN